MKTVSTQIDYNKVLKIIKFEISLRLDLHDYDNRVS